MANAAQRAQTVVDALPNPIEIVDAILDAALAMDADYVWIEPIPLSDDNHLISIEHRGKVVATATLDALLASAVIARLASIAEVDLAASRAATGTVRLRGRERERELVFTLRPGADARAEMTLVTPATRLTVSREQFEDLRAGDRVDHYRVTQRLDAGGMGSVYAVEHNTLGRTYALKVLHGKVLRRDPSSIDRFVREARAAARIQHPNIVDVFDFGFLPDGRPYFVMELLKGSSLADMIDTTGALPPAQAFAIARQLVEALCAAHDHGVIHADVTPSNVFVLDGDPLRIKLADFGLAELRDVAVRDNDADYIMGTPRYVAPEQLRGQPASEASDQYALGIVLFEMLAGDAPFNDPDLRTLCRKHLFDPIPTVQSPHGPLPTEVQALIARCLAKNPGERHPSMRAVRAELDEITRVTDRRGWRRWLAT